MSATQPGNQRHPAMLAVAERRSADLQLRAADAITAFAGSMNFVYLHAVAFAAWMLFFEKSPWPTLTLSRQSKRGCAVPNNMPNGSSNPISPQPSLW